MTFFFPQLQFQAAKKPMRTKCKYGIRKLIINLILERELQIPKRRSSRRNNVVVAYVLFSN